MIARTDRDGRAKFSARQKTKHIGCLVDFA
jgi:hypothetical protein